MQTVNNDVMKVLSDGVAIGLQLNQLKCKTISHFPASPDLLISQFSNILPHEAMLLGAPLLPGSAVDKALEDNIACLRMGQSRLSTVHDALLL